MNSTDVFLFDILMLVKNASEIFEYSNTKFILVDIVKLFVCFKLFKLAIFKDLRPLVHFKFFFVKLSKVESI